MPCDAMDLDSILDGSAMVYLSHEGGEFYELVEHCVETTIKLNLFFICLNKLSHLFLYLESLELKPGPDVIKSIGETKPLMGRWRE